VQKRNSENTIVTNAFSRHFIFLLLKTKSQVSNKNQN
jgi:hypothetical protein